MVPTSELAVDFVSVSILSIFLANFSPYLSLVFYYLLKPSYIFMINISLQKPSNKDKDPKPVDEVNTVQSHLHVHVHYDD